jgi:hypothetical protein
VRADSHNALRAQVRKGGDECADPHCGMAGHNGAHTTKRVSTGEAVMSFRTSTSYAGIMSVALLVGARGGGDGGSWPQPQTIAFATGGQTGSAV